MSSWDPGAPPRVDVRPGAPPGAGCPVGAPPRVGCPVGAPPMAGCPAGSTFEGRMSSRGLPLACWWLFQQYISSAQGFLQKSGLRHPQNHLEKVCRIKKQNQKPSVGLRQQPTARGKGVLLSRSVRHPFLGGGKSPTACSCWFKTPPKARSPAEGRLQRVLTDKAAEMRCQTSSL